jgi:hypothetical protein
MLTTWYLRIFDKDYCAQALEKVYVKGFDDDDDDRYSAFFLCGTLLRKTRRRTVIPFEIRRNS